MGIFFADSPNSVISSSKPGIFNLVSSSVPTIKTIFFTTNRDSGDLQIYSMGYDGSNQTNESRNNPINEVIDDIKIINNSIKALIVSDKDGIAQVFIADYDSINGITNRVQVSSETISISVGSFEARFSNDLRTVIWAGASASSYQNRRGILNARKLDNAGSPIGLIVALSTGLSNSYWRSYACFKSDDTELYYSYFLNATNNWITRRADFDNTNLILSNNADIVNGYNHRTEVVSAIDNKLTVFKGIYPNVDLWRYDFDGYTITNGFQQTNLSSLETNARFGVDETELVYNNNSDGDNEIRIKPNNNSIDNGSQLTNNSVVSDIAPVALNVPQI